jgi:hypothetical protein
MFTHSFPAIFQSFANTLVRLPLTPSYYQQLSRAFLREHSMDRSLYSPNFRNSTAELDVSAELSALRAEVNNKFAKKFFQELKDIKALSVLTPFNKMSSGSDKGDEVQVISDDNIFDRIRKVERDFCIELTRISNRIDHLLNYVKDNTRRIDDLDQERRACCLIFQGVPESETIPPDCQILDILKNKMEVPIPTYPCCGTVQELPKDLVPPFVIAKAFRMGKPRTSAQITEMGPRPIMVHFGSLYYRDKAIMARRKLRGTKLFVSESLTRPRYELLQRAREVVGAKNAWSMEGKIFVITNNIKKRITRLEDLQIPT